MRFKESKQFIGKQEKLLRNNQLIMEDGLVTV
ncbi:hypothetical protein PEC311524_41100 [Pectobacterium carotovorum subsp. carotovorum]|nr:hypothetical protein PEC311524_41100 [Pectobacterium carotovorum subsp. carotovorum]